MAQDLRNLFEKDTEKHGVTMSQGHEARFLERLERELPKQKASRQFSVLNIAASIVLFLGLSFGAYQFFNKNGGDVMPKAEQVVKQDDIKTMGEFSPELKKVEDYYLASINLELSKVQLTPTNKDFVDGYIQRLKELNDEYNNLIVELNENGPNAITLEALINNLKLRLNLVTRLKEKLEEFNTESNKAKAA